MPQALQDLFRERLSKLHSDQPEAVPDIVDLLLTSAREAGASDIHLSPSADGLQVKWRIDGALHEVWTFARALSQNIVARLKVLADLLTYRTDVPQEGRIRKAGNAGDVEMRVSTFPTLHGERAVVRVFASSGDFHFLDELGLPDDAETTLKQLVHETGGLLIVTGPAGSGKTTSIYACLRELVRDSQGQKSLVTLEDPIESAVPGVSQSQVNPAAGFDYETGLRSLLRQDPEVIAVGEIRDRGTAEIVFQASLTGHLVLTTFHAGSSAEAVSRLLDMGIAPYQLRSGLLGIVSQRLVRRLCECAVADETEAAKLGLPVERVRVPAGCTQCHGTGYFGRRVLAELLLPAREELGRAILSHSDASQIEKLAIENAGMIPLKRRACEAVNAGWTSPAEIRRVFGFR